MIVSVTNIFEFLNCINDFLLENHGIEPRNFITIPEARKVLHRTAYLYNRDSGRLIEYECSKFRRELHVHNVEEIGTNNVPYCCEADALAAWYIDKSVFGPVRDSVLCSIHDWLPTATFQFVSVEFSRALVRTYLEPSYASVLFPYWSETSFPSRIRYYYFKSNIDACCVKYNISYNNQRKTVMVRYRSRSPRREGYSRRRRRSSSRRGSERARSRSRSASPYRAKSMNSGTRRYRRSRSRSRSRSYSR